MKNVRHVDIIIIVLLVVVLGCMVYMCVTNRETFDAHGQTTNNGRSPCENLSGESKIRCEKDLA